MENLVIINLLYLFGIVQALFFSLLFLVKKKRLSADIIAGIWLIIFALEFSIITWINLSRNDLSLISDIELLFTLLHGPFLYFYIKKLLLKQNSFELKESLHFLPFFIGLLFVTLFHRKDMVIIIPFAGITSGLTYIIHSIRIILKFKSYPDLTSDTTKNIRWLLNLSIGLLFVWILPLVIVNVLRLLQKEVEPEVFYILVPVFIFYLSFRGVSQQLIYILPTHKDTVRIGHVLNNQNLYRGSYTNSTLGNEEMKNIYLLLNQYMLKTKLFLNPGLSLKIVSDEMKIPQQYITQTLNVYSDQNFNDFVNQYRVNEFKQRIRKTLNKNYTLFGIANECGFNSKPTFNRVFKKITGKTPTEYIKEHNC